MTRNVRGAKVDFLAISDRHTATHSSSARAASGRPLTVPTDNAARFATMGVVGRLIRNASKQARQVSKGSRRLTPGCCFAVPFGLSELVKMLRWFRRRSQTIKLTGDCV